MSNILFEKEPLPRSVLFREAFGRYLTIIRITCVVTILICFLPDAMELMALPLVSFYVCISAIISRYGIIKKQIVKIEFEGDMLHFYIEGKEGVEISSIARDNFRIRYFHDGKHWDGFLIEQRKPYKNVFTQYRLGHWKDETSMEFLSAYGIVGKY